MVRTRSARPLAAMQATSDERFPQKNSASGSKEHPEDVKELDEQSTAESHSTQEHSAVLRTPKNRKNKSRSEGLLSETIEPSADGETSEAESNYSSVSEPQDPIIRITRRRRILVPCTPVSRKRPKIASVSESYTDEVVSEAESHASGFSPFVPSTVTATRTRRREAKYLTDTSQESHAEETSDAESSCSDISTLSGIAVGRTTRSMYRKLQGQMEEKDFKIVSRNKKKSCNDLNKEPKGRVSKGKGINDKSPPLKSLSEFQDSSPQQVVSQKHSTPDKPTSECSNPSYENVLKSLSQTFAVVEVDRLSEEKESSIKPSDLTESDEEECTVLCVNEETDHKNNVSFECDPKLCESEHNTSQIKSDSVLLALSSDESQESENSENEEDTICFVGNSDQRESLNGDSGSKSPDTALFVIDKTPGLTADKIFYLEEEDKVSEAAAEKEREEGEDEKSELSDHEGDADSELSDEDDLLNNTKSKLLKLTSSSIDPGLSVKELGGLYINFNAGKLQSNKRPLTQQIKEKTKNELLKKTIITPDFEKNYSVPPYRESKFQLRKKRREERQKTAGSGWFGMKAPELTDELKNDLKALKMRASMDPKRFYKKNDRDGFPKYFQIGTIVDNPADFYHSRIPKKERKRTIVEELLADSEFRKFNRRKYLEIMSEKAANAAGKRFRKKKKFRN
ncbi:PREDICTED: deoxynucleotidyltransferase terminal-interacting protein 2 [Elephantulus edwardii]|uniref:deoxynucleotidyltransferase terminal-interacting protein 2 n=1 Tax=Elephantulus edwardii TaxID=28737 RepID=UPI0003F0DB3C|nr:PREDICTED: deoxynucleotidyltransferase terminal-interacting protein 2 [Elephantulus edwardii]